MSDTQRAGHTGNMENSYIKRHIRKGYKMTAQMSCEKIQEIFRKEEIRIDFMGASATEGEGLHESRDAYPFLWRDAIKTKFPQKRFRVRNLAQSGTFASHGLFAAEEFVRENKTDIVFLEYALNDKVTPFSVAVYESLVRKILGYSGVVVIPIVLPDREEVEDRCDRWIEAASGQVHYMIEIARQYQMPWLDIGKELCREMHMETMRWEDYAQDNTHPNRQGHIWIARKIMTLFEEMLCFPVAKKPDWSLPESCYFGNAYENLQMQVFSQDLSFPMDFSVECSSFWVVYRKHYDDACGTLQVYLDQKALVPLYGYSMFCWDYYFPEKVWQSDKKEKHTFSFKMLPQDEKKEFKIRAVGWC